VVIGTKNSKIETVTSLSPGQGNLTINEQVHTTQVPHLPSNT